MDQLNVALAGLEVVQLCTESLPWALGITSKLITLKGCSVGKTLDLLFKIPSPNFI
jgi:hypothetical protein